MRCSKCHRSTRGGDGELCQSCRDRAEERRPGIIELARQQREDEGRVEIDDDARLSESTDNGCYVQAWVWVDFGKTRFDKKQTRRERSPEPHLRKPSTNKK